MKIYIIRHGEAAKSWEVDRDPELSLRGREQAQNISDILVQEDLNDFQIISSPLRRAIETAEPISKKLKKEVEINESFIEIPSPCLLYTSPSPRDISGSRMPSSA